MADSVKIRITGDDSAFKRTLNGTKTAIKGLGLVSGAVSAAWNIAGLATVKYNANLETLTTSFKVMTGSAEKAEEIVSRLNRMGAETPFETTDLVQTTQLLMQYGFAADDAIDRMSMLGDIAQGNAEAMTSIAMGYAQMSSAGKVNLQDIRQMINGGFNPLQEISERTGESMASLYDRISKGKMAVDEITESMRHATSEGGKYYKSMEEQSKTLNGLLSTLQDNSQQLLGRVFDPMTTGLRTKVLPEAIALVDELNGAFERNGFDGLTDALLNQIPKLTSAAVTAAQKAISGVTKKLPQLIGGLASALPGVLDSGGILTADLVDALFGMAAVALEELGSRLPELAPVLLSGAVRLAESVFSGIANAVIGLGKGIGVSLKKLGVLGWSSEELLDQLFGNYDRTRVEELKAQIDVTPEATVDPKKVKLDSVYEAIETALTDGLADTPEIINDLKQQVLDYYNAEIESVNTWKQEALADLDTSLPQSEYEAAAKAIEEQANGMVASLQSASNQTIAFIDENAGESTKSVEENVDKLYKIYQSAVGYRDKVAELTGEVRTMGDQQRRVVASGQSSDEGTMISAIAYTAQEYSDAMAAATEKKEQALAEALASFSEGTDEYKKREEEIIAEYESAVSGAQDTLTANMSKLWSGIAESLAPDQQQLLAGLAQKFRAKDLATKLITSMTDALDEVGAGMDASAYTDFFSGILDGMKLSESDWQMLADALGIDATGAEAIRNALIEQLSEAVSGAGMNTVLGEALNGMVNGAEGELISAFQNAGGELPEELCTLIQTAIESGLMDGVEGVDSEKAKQMLYLLAGGIVDETAATIGEHKIPVGIGVDPEFEESAATDQEIADGITEQVQNAAPESVDADTKVNTNVTTGSTSEIENSVNEKLKDQQMDVNVKANVTLDVTLGDSNAGAVGEAAGATIGEGVVRGLSSKNDSIRAAGVQAGNGFARGLASTRFAIIATARSIANSVATTISRALDIHSPSRVTGKLGMNAGLGFDLELQKSLRSAVTNARQIVGTLNLSPKLTAPDLSSAFEGATERFTDGIQVSPVLVLNGKVVASALADDSARAQNSRNRQIAMGVGK